MQSIRVPPSRQQAHRAVIHQQSMAGFNLVNETGVGCPQAHTRLLAPPDHVATLERHLVARRKLETLAHATKSDLRALKITQNTDDAPKPGRSGTHGSEALNMFVFIAVTEVQTE